MTSATPHDGKPASFASLMNMLNPTAIANPNDYGKDDIKGLFVRRFKKDIQDQIAGGMKERRVLKLSRDASPEEERAYEILAGLKFRSLDRAQRTGQLLFRTVLEKALFSSPAACLQDRDRPPEEAGSRRFAGSRARSRGASGTGHRGRSHHARRFHQIPEAARSIAPRRQAGVEPGRTPPTVS